MTQNHHRAVEEYYRDELYFTAGDKDDGTPKGISDEALTALCKKYGLDETRFIRHLAYVESEGRLGVPYNSKKYGDNL